MKTRILVLSLLVLLLVVPAAAADEGWPGCPMGYAYNPISHDVVWMCLDGQSAAVKAVAVKPSGLAQSASAATDSSSPDAVLAWNTIAQRTVIQVGGLSPAHAFITIAYAQAAVYDAVIAIEGGYQPYKLDLQPRPDASLDAAVAAAAHDVLLHYFPQQQAALDADYAAALAAIPDGAAKSDGIQVGQEAAAGIIALRQDDGYGADIGFVMPPPAPGVWQLPANQSPMTPWVAEMLPFMLERPDQFRPGPPMKLTSSQWTADYNEVKAMGAINSPYRSAEQTDVARFWSTNPPAQYNTAFQQLVRERGFHAVQAARLFAMGDLVASDALIACWDAKYHYLFWRPVFAIRQGDTDGNPGTAGDPEWQSLLGAPPHPEYPSAHGCVTAAIAEVFTEVLGTNKIGVELASTVPGLMHPTRTYAHAKDLIAEIEDARVWAGIHYRTSDVRGVNVGRKVAHWTLDRYFLPAD